MRRFVAHFNFCTTVMKAARNPQRFHTTTVGIHTETTYKNISTMRSIRIILLAFFTSTIVLSCDKDKNDSEECTGTTVSTIASGYDNQVNSTVEHYNECGFLTRVETSFFDSKNDYYETYKYDSNNRIVEYFSSNEGYSKYHYDAGNKVKTEFYDLNMFLTGYNTFEYSGNTIIDKKKYSADGRIDTSINYFYSHGFLDSTITKSSNELKTIYDKMYYKYDSKGNNIERLRYSNYESDDIELFQSYHYEYDDKSNLIRYEFRDKNGDLGLGTYFRYEYNGIGNLIKTKIYDSSDNQIDSILIDYQFCKEIKLIKPER